MADTDSGLGLTRVYGFDPAAGWTLLEDDLGSVREAVPVDGGVAVATSHAGVDTLRYSKDGRTWSDLATIDPPDVPALQPETARSAAWVFSRGPRPSRAP